MKKLSVVILLSLFSIAVYCQTKVIAHRGFWNIEGAAQNAVSSLYKAYEYGCYGTEFDVYLTSDGVLVLHHDGVIEGAQIEKTPYSKIKDTKLENGELIPTVEQFLIHAKNCPGIKLIYEVKPHTGNALETKVAEKVVEMIKQFGMEDRTEYISFSKHLCTELKRLSPKTSVSYLGSDLSPKELKALNLDMDHHYTPLLQNPAKIKEAKELGLLVNVWTVNDAEAMKKLIELDVDYITTDKPLLLQSVIKELK